jgi:hypothetical protein
MQSNTLSKFSSNFGGRPKKPAVRALPQWVDWWRDMKRYEGKRHRKRPPDLEVPSQAELAEANQ